jgi:hypothetical protein
MVVMIVLFVQTRVASTYLAARLAIFKSFRCLTLIVHPGCDTATSKACRKTQAS